MQAESKTYYMCLYFDFDISHKTLERIRLYRSIKLILYGVGRAVRGADRPGSAPFRTCEWRIADPTWISIGQHCKLPQKPPNNSTHSTNLSPIPSQQGLATNGLASGASGSSGVFNISAPMTPPFASGLSNKLPDKFRGSSIKGPTRTIPKLVPDQ